MPGSDPGHGPDGRGKLVLDEFLQARTGHSRIGAEQLQHALDVPEGRRRGPADQGGVATPAPVGRARAESCPHWVEGDVSDYGEQVRVRLDELGVVAIADEA